MMKIHKHTIRIHDNERDHSEYMCPCENNIKMDLKGTEGEVVDWIDLTQDRDKWRVIVSTMMNLPFPKTARNSLNR